MSSLLLFILLLLPVVPVAGSRKRFLFSCTGISSILSALVLYVIYSNGKLPKDIRSANFEFQVTMPLNKCPNGIQSGGDPDTARFWGDTPINENVEVEKCPLYRTFSITTDDLLCMSPPQFWPNYKNPCWKSLEKRGLLCLPYFQVIGVDKSGSTDLFSRISQHPDVEMNKGVLQKETQWWPWKRYGHMTISSIKKEWFPDYLDYFTDAAKIIDSKVNGTGYRHVITGDGTPMDFWDQTGWKQIPQNYGLKEPKYVTPHLIKHVNPGVKLILILRDPVARVFSDYFFLGLCEQSTGGFHRSVKMSIEELTRCRSINSLRSCLYNRTLHLYMKARIHLSFYATYMKEWLSVFPREQFLIFRTEEYSKDTAGHLRKAFDFLGLRQLSEDELEKIVKKGRAHVTQNRANKNPMYEETRQLLEDLFRPENHALAKILNDDNYKWKL